VPSDVPEHTARTKNNDIRVVARKALVQLLEPLVGFVLDSGLSTQDLRAILREAAVRSVASRQLEVARRVNISGIAASTGIPRAEISRILKSSPDSSRQTTDRQQQSTNRILAVWHQDPKFTAPSGKPADLKIYGRGATFDALVRNHGRGIPTRAMLDELTRAGAAEVLSSQLVRVKTSVAVDRGVTPRAIRSFGERANELLSTMLQNMRNPENPQFIASISGTNISSTVLPLFRRELATKGADFLADLQDSMFREATNGLAKRHRTRSSRVNVTIFYHETPRTAKPRKTTVKKRRNFRRDD
jgi:DNA-binding phage protein